MIANMEDRIKKITDVCSIHRIFTPLPPDTLLGQLKLGPSSGAVSSRAHWEAALECPGMYCTVTVSVP